MHHGNEKGKTAQDMVPAFHGCTPLKKVFLVSEESTQEV